MRQVSQGGNRGEALRAPQGGKAEQSTPHLQPRLDLVGVEVAEEWPAWCRLPPRIFKLTNKASIKLTTKHKMRCVTGVALDANVMIANVRCFPVPKAFSATLQQPFSQQMLRFFIH